MAGVRRITKRDEAIAAHSHRDSPRLRESDHHADRDHGIHDREDLSGVGSRAQDQAELIIGQAEAASWTEPDEQHRSRAGTRIIDRTADPDRYPIVPAPRTHGPDSLRARPIVPRPPVRINYGSPLTPGRRVRALSHIPRSPEFVLVRGSSLDRASSRGRVQAVPGRSSWPPCRKSVRWPRTATSRRQQSRRPRHMPRRGCR